MANNLVKQAGIAAIAVLAGVLIWSLQKVGSLNLSFGDLALIIVIISGAGYIVYCVISHYTGATVSDATQFKTIIEKLMDLLDNDSESNEGLGDLGLDSTGSNTTS